MIVKKLTKGSRCRQTDHEFPFVHHGQNFHIRFVTVAVLVKVHVHRVLQAAKVCQFHTNLQCSCFERSK